ncbi:MAG: glycine dehydrogenase, partial [Gemmatimonadales bacterium]
MSDHFSPSRDFADRHLGPSDSEVLEMLDALGVDSLDQLIRETVPGSILRDEPLDLPEAVGEHDLLDRLKEIAGENQVLRSYIGMGYHGTLVPGVIQRNILENPGWYTQYTPYQAEIAQGRLEALLNFQTMCMDLTGLDIGSASLLDEGTAAAEAMSMLAGVVKGDRHRFLVADTCHPQTIAVLQTRAEPVGIVIEVGNWRAFEPDENTIGALVSYPDTEGAVEEYGALADQLHGVGAYLVAVADLLSLAVLAPPAEWGADVVVGNSQRFGVPMGYGGPHAAYMTAREEFARKMPGRIIGVSVDAHGNRALRMALQTREQHIRREKATSNICTAQVLLAIMAGMYGVYHGPTGLRRIATRVHGAAAALADGLSRLGHEVVHRHFFDTLKVRPSGRSSGEVLSDALALGINLRDFGDGTVGVALDETVRDADLADLLRAFNGGEAPAFTVPELAGTEKGEAGSGERIPDGLARTAPFMDHPVFNSYHSETEMLRYIHRLETKDLSLNTSMIPLGSCTMKLNATTEMAGVTWPEFGGLHPFAPRDQATGYRRIFSDLEAWLAEITGFSAVSLQPNSGAQGEYAGLQVIRAYHLDRGDAHRKVCLIPSSAHGTNP